MRTLPPSRSQPARSTACLAFLFVVFLSGCGLLGTDEGDPPTAPEGVDVTASQSEVAVSWNGSSEATGYNVYRSEESIPDDLSGVVPANGNTPIEDGTSFTDPEVDNSTTYFYRVTAVNDGGESTPSAEVEVMTPYPEPPGRP